MKCLLKISFTFLLIILLSQSLRAQLDCRNGYYLPTSGTIRVLVIFAEVNYDIGSDPFPSTGYAGWPAGQLPVWKDELFDPYVTTNPQGVFTKFFKEASFGAYNVIGDYLINPEHPCLKPLNDWTKIIN